MSSKLLFTNGNNPSNPFKLGDHGVEFPGNLLQSAGAANSGATNNFAYIENWNTVYLSTETYTYLFANSDTKYANNTCISEIEGGGVLISSYTTCDYALCVINITLDFYCNNQNISEDDFFYTLVIQYEYRSSPNSEFVTGEFVVNDLLYSTVQTYVVYFIINNVYQIKNISAKIRTDYITTELENVVYTTYYTTDLLILFFKNNNNSDNSSNNNLALTNTVNQINNMSTYYGSFNNNKTNCYMMSKYTVGNGGDINIYNNTITGSFDIDGIGIETLDNTNIPNYFYTNYNFNNEIEIAQYLTFIDIKLANFYFDIYVSVQSLLELIICTGNGDLYKFSNIVDTSTSDSYKYDMFYPSFDKDILTTTITNVNFGDFYLNIFRTTYIPESSSPTNNYINFRSVSDNVTQSTVLPNNVSQCINNSMSFAHFKVENLGSTHYLETTQVQPLSYYINSNTTIIFNSNIDPSVLSFNNTTKKFILNGVFAVFAIAETYQVYNNHEFLINTGYSLVIKMGFSSSGPFFFTKIASLFQNFHEYLLTASDFSMINALKGITSELYINNINDGAEVFNSNTIDIENLELFFLQLS